MLGAVLFAHMEFQPCFSSIRNSLLKPARLVGTGLPCGKHPRCWSPSLKASWMGASGRLCVRGGLTHLYRGQNGNRYTAWGSCATSIEAWSVWKRASPPQAEVKDLPSARIDNSHVREKQSLTLPAYLTAGWTPRPVAPAEHRVSAYLSYAARSRLFTRWVRNVWRLVVTTLGTARSMHSWAWRSRLGSEEEERPTLHVDTTNLSLLPP